MAVPIFVLTLGHKLDHESKSIGLILLLDPLGGILLPIGNGLALFAFVGLILLLLLWLQKNGDLSGSEHHCSIVSFGPDTKTPFEGKPKGLGKAVTSISL